MRLLVCVLIAALVVCMFTLPYHALVLLHLFIAVALGYMGFVFYSSECKDADYVCLVLTILFQPLLRIPMGDKLWPVLCGALAVILFVFLFFDKPLSRFMPKVGSHISSIKEKSGF